MTGFRTNHERFGELSALALIGQASPAQYQELRLHLDSCDACRAEYADFEVILSKHLPLLHEQLSPAETKRTDIETGLTGILSETREVSRNLQAFEVQHVPNDRGEVNSREKRWSFFGHLSPWAAAVSLGLLMAAAFLSLRLYQYVEQERSQVVALSALKSEVTLLRNQIRNSRPVMAPAVATQQNNSETDRSSENSELAMRAIALEKQLRASRDELSLLKNELEAARGMEKEISARASEGQERLEKTSQELEAAIQDRNQVSAAIVNKRQVLEALNLDLAALRDTVDRDRKLLAADRDIRDLMGARNLRIIDVFDVDGKGRTRKPFGRVFFTEGKSLVFYAFDLDHVSSSVQAAAFQAWGSQGPYVPTARSLGVFYCDDQTANRWILKFDDPQVLAEIDSVFVTVEPPGGSRKPTGTRLLSAYLKADLNHP